MRPFKNILFLWLISLLIPACAPGPREPIARQEVTQEKTLTRSGIEIASIFYESEGQKMEAFTFRPVGSGPFPGLVLVHPHSDVREGAALFVRVGRGERLALQRYAVFAISQPGYGRSEGKPDYVGPRTVKGVLDGIEYFRNLPYVDKERIGLWGYSRGAMVAALAATKTKAIKAVVLVAGAYDFKKFYESTGLEGIRRNISWEAGTSKKAFYERSAINFLDELAAPVLILHGNRDINVPVDQAYILRDALTKLGKPFELFIFPNYDHFLPPSEVWQYSLTFFDKYLKAGSPRSPEG